MNLKVGQKVWFAWIEYHGTFCFRGYYERSVKSGIVLSSSDERACVKLDGELLFLVPGEFFLTADEAWQKLRGIFTP